MFSFVIKKPASPRRTAPSPQTLESRANAAKMKILKKQAADYLPYRLAFLAQKYGFTYTLGKLGLRTTRWGSCTSKKVISLNIALMKVSKPLQDYVLIHELCHTRHLNHSKNFWDEVAKYDPSYKEHRKSLKAFKPTL
jgi:predicted metal-dependent hydrolase